MDDRLKRVLEAVNRFCCERTGLLSDSPFMRGLRQAIIDAYGEHRQASSEEQAREIPFMVERCHLEGDPVLRDGWSNG